MLRLVRIDYPSPELVNDAVRLRRWELRDLECVRLASTDPRIPTGTTVPTVYSPAEGAAFIERQWSRLDNDEGMSLAMEERASRSAVGLIVGLFRPQPHVVGLGYWVVPPARGSGYARQAIALLAPWLLLETDTTRVEALVEPTNTPSRRALERCGFQEEGHLRSYLEGTNDAIIYSLIRSDALIGMDSGAV
jgi:RimJ/RimL family protein N-acetyltransferase